MSTVTLITPCFNGENHLDNYIKGLLSQTASNVEIMRFIVYSFTTYTETM